MYMLSEI